MGLLVADKIETRPQLLKLAVKVMKIASGANHLVMLGSDHQVYSMGCGEQGQLGRVTQRSADRDSRQGVGMFHCVVQLFFHSIPIKV